MHTNDTLKVNANMCVFLGHRFSRHVQYRPHITVPQETPLKSFLLANEYILNRYKEIFICTVTLVEYSYIQLNYNVLPVDIMSVFWLGYPGNSRNWRVNLHHEKLWQKYSINLMKIIAISHNGKFKNGIQNIFWHFWSSTILLILPLWSCLSSSQNPNMCLASWWRRIPECNNKLNDESFFMAYFIEYECLTITIQGISKILFYEVAISENMSSVYWWFPEWYVKIK